MTLLNVWSKVRNSIQEPTDYLQLHYVNPECLSEQLLATILLFYDFAIAPEISRFQRSH